MTVLQNAAVGSIFVPTVQIYQLIPNPHATFVDGRKVTN